MLRQRRCLFPLTTALARWPHRQPRCSTLLRWASARFLHTPPSEALEAENDGVEGRSTVVEDATVAVTRNSNSASVCAQLEARLPRSPITPNDALTLLVQSLRDAASSLFSLAVVQHLVQVAAGNAYCLNPTTCVDLMELLLTPAMPRVLCNRKQDDDVDAFLSSTDDVGVAVRVALIALHETLVRCAAVHLRMKLLSKEDGREDWSDSMWELHAFSPSRFVNAVKVGENLRNNGAAGGGESDAELLRGAAVLLAFTTSHDFHTCDRDTRRDRNVASNPWPSYCATYIVYPVLRRLSATGELRGAGRDGKVAAERAEIHRECRWLDVCAVARPCWWWSVLLCRAVPLLPTRVLRATVVAGLQASLHTFHDGLVTWTSSAAHRDEPQDACRRRLTCLCGLHWLLVYSLPILNGTEKDGAPCQAPVCSSIAAAQAVPWTSELRTTLMLLANDFADLATASLLCKPRDPADSQSEQCRQHLVEMMASVAFRVALQHAAAARTNPSQNPQRSAEEVKVVQKLMRHVLSQPLIVRSSCHASTSQAHEEMKPAKHESPLCAVDTVSISEDTWCKLTCLQRFAGDANGDGAREGTTDARCARWIDLDSGEGGGRSVSADQKSKLEAGLMRLFQMGADHLRAWSHAAASTAQTTGATPAGTDGATLESENGIAKAPHASLAARIFRRNETVLPPVSLELLFLLVKCWRACSGHLLKPAGVQWMRRFVQQRRGCPVARTAPSHHPSAVKAARRGGVAESGASSTEGQMTGIGDPDVTVPEQTEAVAGDDTGTERCFLTSAHSLSQNRDAQRVREEFSDRFSSSLNEAWAAALELRQDHDPLDVCAGWCAVSTPFAHDAAELSKAEMSPCHGIVPSPHTAMLKAVTGCESRLAYQCSEWLYHLKDLETGIGAYRYCRLGELRPRVLPKTTPDMSLIGFSEECEAVHEKWQPLFLSACVAHIGLRLLHTDVHSSANPVVDRENSMNGNAPRLPFSAVLLETLRRSLESPPQLELLTLQATIVATYGAWCDSVNVHPAWGCVNVEDCCCSDRWDGRDVARTGSPWWMLTVEGLVSLGGLQRASDMTALIYLWARGTQQTHEACCRVVEEHTLQSKYLANPFCRPYGCSAGAIAPLTPNLEQREQRRVQRQPFRCSTPWLRHAIAEWSHCYALRLVLFHLGEQRLQRRRAWIPNTEPPSSLSTVTPQLHRRARVASDVTCAKKVAFAPHAARIVPAGHGDGASMELRTTLSPFRSPNPTLYTIPSSVWHSEALYSVLRGAACRLLRVVERLSRAMLQGSFSSGERAAVIAAGMPTDPVKVPSQKEIRVELARHLERLSGLPQSSGVSHVSLGDLAAQVLTAAREREAAPQVRVGSTYAGQRSLLGLSRRLCLCPRDPVRDLEDMLQSLGLRPTDDTCGIDGSCCAAGARKVRNGDALLCTEECQLLLTVFCLAPEETFVSSPALLRFARDTLWSTGWKWLVKASADSMNAVVKAAPNDRVTGSGFAAACPRHAGSATTEAAELDALVTCRLMLRATHQFHRLAEECVECFCRAYMPAVRDATRGPSRWFTSTPVEELERQRAARAGVSPGELGSTGTRGHVQPDFHHHRVKGDSPRPSSGKFCFSPSALRTYEVLCHGAWEGQGERERRLPCVWQQWMQELTHDDAVLQQHPLLHRHSRLVRERAQKR